MAAGLVTVWAVRRRGSDWAELLGWSLMAPLGLMTGYHNLYDAVVLLLLPLAWIISADWRAGRGLLLVISSDVIAMFVAPGAPMLHAFANRGYIPSTLVESPIWTYLLVPHQVWGLVALSLVMLWSDRGTQSIAAYSGTRQTARY